MRTVGVEEELLLVDPVTGVPTAVAGMLLRAADAASDPAGEIEAELQQQQIEVETSPTRDLAELAQQIRDWRLRADELGQAAGVRAVALATSPLPVDPIVTAAPRYRRMVEHFGLTTLEQLTCGCHVHVGVDSDDEGAAVIDRIQVWLPTLLALSANSPFWQGRDSGYASFRSQVWARLPTAGPTSRFGSGSAYRRTVTELVATGVPLDPDMIYFNARLSRHYPTVELRVADVCAGVDDAVLIAALARALVDTAAREWTADEPLATVGTEQLSLATWQASRFGLTGTLLDPTTHRPRPAVEVVHRLLDHVGAALHSNGDEDRVQTAIDRLQVEGTGAEQQRAIWQRTHDLSAVVRAAVSG